MTFQDPHLAESVGYANGHANGLHVGKAAGYTEGWNAATIHANGVIDERDAVTEKLYAANARLAAETRELKDKLHLMQEQALSLRSDYENILKAFHGVVAIASPMVPRVAELPLAIREPLVMSYVDFAQKLQGEEYVAEHGLPHNQPLIKKYFPVATAVIRATVKEMRANDENKKHSAHDATHA